MSMLDYEQIDLHELRRRSPRFRERALQSVSFPIVDTWEGQATEPISLHKYLYANANPVTYTDPTGNWSLAGTLAVAGITALGISILLPSIRGAWNQAYHVAANGQTQNIFTATFMGQATLADWKRVLSGFGSGAGAGAINVLDTLSFRLIDPLHEYRDQLWRAEGLDQSWVGTTSNGFAWAGTGLLYSAALVWTLNAAGVPQMSVSVRYTGQAPKFIHFEYGVNGAWQQAMGRGGWIITGSGEGLQITGIPVLFPGAVLAGDRVASAYNCATAVMRAIFRGWGGW